MSWDEAIKAMEAMKAVLEAEPKMKYCTECLKYYNPDTEFHQVCSSDHWHENTCGECLHVYFELEYKQWN